jgi:thiamine-phosphate pyrophosphorylase
LPRDNKPVLCYVTDRRSIKARPPASALAGLIANCARVAALGVDWIQVREKDLAGGALLELASEIQRRAGRTRVLVNDRLDVALAAGAGGVHLGSQGLPVAAVREFARRLPAGFLIGKSCHSLGEARAAESAGAHYIFFGPVFATPSKLAYGPPQGIEHLNSVCAALTIPVFAIGGIAPENAAECVAAGASGIAAIRCFQEAEGLDQRITLLRAALG